MLLREPWVQGGAVDECLIRHGICLQLCKVGQGLTHIFNDAQANPAIGDKMPLSCIPRHRVSLLLQPGQLVLCGLDASDRRAG